MPFFPPILSGLGLGLRLGPPTPHPAIHTVYTIHTLHAVFLPPCTVTGGDLHTRLTSPRLSFFFFSLLLLYLLSSLSLSLYLGNTVAPCACLPTLPYASSSPVSFKPIAPSFPPSPTISLFLLLEENCYANLLSLSSLPGPANLPRATPQSPPKKPPKLFFSHTHPPPLPLNLA